MILVGITISVANVVNSGYKYMKQLNAQCRLEGTTLPPQLCATLLCKSVDKKKKSSGPTMTTIELL